MNTTHLKQNLMINLITNRWVIIGLLILTIVVGQRFYSMKLESTQNKLEISRNNEKAYQKDTEIWKDRYGQEHAKSLMFMETVASFKKTTDSTSKRMLEIVEQQNIKLNKLERIAYSRTGVNTTLIKEIDIPTMPDTILDLSTKWVKNKIHLSPLNVSSEISFENETITTMNVKKEPVGLPKDTFFGRLFQKWFGKKQIIIEGETIQTNPLVENKEQKFIHFYKD